MMLFYTLTNEGTKYLSKDYIFHTRKFMLSMMTTFVCQYIGHMPR